MKEITLTPELLKMTPIELATILKNNLYDKVIVDSSHEELIRLLKKAKIEVYEPNNRPNKPTI
jgi:hypothetical protein